MTRPWRTCGGDRGQAKAEGGSRPISRILSAPIARWGDHLSRAGVTTGLQRPTWCSAGHLDAPAWPCSGRGSPGRRRHHRRRCALTAPFHPYRRGLTASAVCFLLHVPRVATPGGYPASCPVESGLSSMDVDRPPRPPGRLPTQFYADSIAPRLPRWWTRSASERIEEHAASGDGRQPTTARRSSTSR